MDNSSTLDTQLALAARAGVSQSHISEILRGTSAVTLDLVNDLAYALGIEPWILLASSDEARKLAEIAKIAFGPGVSDREVEKHLPAAPKEEVAPKRKKRRHGGGGNQMGSSR